MSLPEALLLLSCGYCGAVTAVPGIQHSVLRLTLLCTELAWILDCVVSLGPQTWDGVDG